MICHSGRSKHLDDALGGRSEGVETLLGRFKRGRFVKAPFPRPCLNVSMSPCLYVTMSLCLYVVISLCHVSMSPCFRFRKQKTELTEKATSVCFLQMENENDKLSFVCCKRKQKMDVFFPWSVNDNSNRRVLFQQTYPSMHNT